MSYRLISANQLANKYPEVNDMNCIYADLPNGLDNKFYLVTPIEPYDEFIRQDCIRKVHEEIYKFFDVCRDDEEVPMSEKDKLLLEVNKAICNAIRGGVKQND